MKVPFRCSWGTFKDELDLPFRSCRSSPRPALADQDASRQRTLDARLALGLGWEPGEDSWQRGLGDGEETPLLYYMCLIF